MELITLVSLITIITSTDGHHSIMPPGKRYWAGFNRVKVQTKIKSRQGAPRRAGPVIVLTLIILVLIFIVFYLLVQNPAR